MGDRGCSLDSRCYDDVALSISLRSSQPTEACDSSRNPSATRNTLNRNIQGKCYVWQRLVLLFVTRLGSELEAVIIDRLNFGKFYTNI